MKRLSTVALLVLVAVAAMAAPEAQLYVAPNGDDASPGTLQKPFATLARARDEARKLKGTAPIKIIVRGGRYLLPETLALGTDDAGTATAPVTYIAFKGEKPLLAGARAITGFKTWKGGILQADLKGTPLEKVAFRQLFCNGERQVMARYPNVDPADPHGGKWAHIMSVDGDAIKDRFHYSPDVEKNWTKVDQAEIGIHPQHDWAWNTVGVKSVDRKDTLITLKGNVSYDLRVGDRYFVQNLLEELDAPGEWYLDRDQSVLYFWPPKGALGPQDEVMAATMASVVSLKDTANVTLRGFTIEACDGTAVTLDNCESCLLAGNVIRNCGGWAVQINGGHNTGARGNDIYATGAGGIGLTGGDRKTLEPGNNYASNNYIHHIAQFAKTYNTGINIGGVGNWADHNLIHDTYHAGMTLNGNDNVVEYNVVHHTNLGSADTGGIYFCSRDFTQRGNKIQYNIFHHCGGYGKSNSWAPVQNGKVEFSYPHFTWGIYLDDPTTGTLVYGNILYAVPICGLHNHGGRDNTWENNIVVDAPAVNAGMLWDGWGEYPAILQKLKAVQYEGSPYLQKYPELAQYNENRPSAMTGLKFVRNIFYYTPEGSRWLREKNKQGWQGGQLLYSYSTHVDDFPKNTFDYNLVSPAAGVDLKINLRRQPESGKLMDWAEWQSTGMDTHSLVADPLFVNPAQNDYRLRPESPALKLGFKQIPVEKIGLQEDEMRASWPVVEAPGASALGDFTTTEYFKLPGYEPVKAQEFVPRDGAPNFFAKLTARQPVKVAYFGGGIHPVDGWRKQVLTWLREQNPGVDITEIDASICDCSRGSGFSAYRFEQDVLSKKPDLVLIDFASDDYQTNVDDIWNAVEGPLRQARKADPNLDVMFVYAFRQGYEEAFAGGVSPSTISGYEKLAERYGVPSVNMAYRVAQMAQEGKLVIRATPEEAKTLKVPVFSSDGVRPSSAANTVYAEAIIDGLKELSGKASVQPHALPEKPLARNNLERARLVAITDGMLQGKWEKLPPDSVGGRSFASHFNEVWFTNAPGAKLTFRFKGTDVSIFNLMGPDTGIAKVTVDGKEVGTRQQVDPWAYYQRLTALPLASGLPDTDHTITVELLPTVPDRALPIAEAKKSNQYKPEQFEGVALRFGWLRLRGELLQ